MIRHRHDSTPERAAGSRGAFPCQTPAIMFSVPHLVVIFVVALIIFGPEKLPDLARNLGKVMGEFRKATGELQSTFEGHLRDIERDAEARRIGGGTAGAATTADGATDPTGAATGEGLLPPSPFESIPTDSPEGTKPSDPPNAAAIAAGNAAADASAKGVPSEPVSPAKTPPHDPSSLQTSPPEHGQTQENTFDHVSDAGFGQS